MNDVSSVNWHRFVKGLLAPDRRLKEGRHVQDRLSHACRPDVGLSGVSCEALADGISLTEPLTDVSTGPGYCRYAADGLGLKFTASSTSSA
jgi:hypothetical protein